MVSVIIPSYNREKTISRSILSVLKQTYTDIEVLVVDDGSNDDTRKVVQEIRDSRIRYIYQPNAGACAARNHGIELSKGEYIAFQDSDDEWVSDKLEKQLDVLNNNADIDIVCCQTKCKRLDGSYFYSMTDLPNGIISEERGPYGISTQTLLMRRCVTDKIKFDINVTRYQDLDFMLGAMRYFTTYYINEFLVIRTIGKDSITNHPERVYLMAEYFQKKHSEILKEKNNRLGHFLSGALMEAGMLQQKNGISFYKKALELEHTPKSLMKLLLFITHIYPVYRKWTENKLRNYGGSYVD